MCSTNYWKGQVNDVIISDYSGASIRYVNSEGSVQVEVGEIARIELEIDIPFYPLEKSRVELFDQPNGLTFSAVPDENGMVQFELDLYGPREYNFEILLLNPENQLVTNSVLQVIVVRVIDLDFRSSISECQTLLLEWEPYISNDFELYELFYSAGSDEGTEDLLSGYRQFTDPNETSVELTDFALLDSIDIVLVVRSNALTDAAADDSIRISSPVDFRVNKGGNLFFAELIEDNHLATIFESFTAQFPTFADIDLDQQMVTCSEGTSFVDVRASGTVNGEYVMVALDGMFLRLYDRQFRRTKSILTGNIGTSMQFVSGGYVASKSIFDEGQIFLVDIENDQTEPAIIYDQSKYSFLQYLASGRSDELFVILTDLETNEDVLHRYQIQSVEDVTLASRHNLMPYRPSGSYKISSSSNRIVSNSGAVFTVTDSDVTMAGSLFPATVMFNEYFINERTAVFHDRGALELLVYDLDSRAQLGINDYCFNNMNFIGLSDQDKLISVHRVGERAAFLSIRNEVGLEHWPNDEVLNCDYSSNCSRRAILSTFSFLPPMTIFSFL